MSAAPDLPADPLDALVGDTPPPVDPLDTLVDAQIARQLGAAKDGARLGAPLDPKATGRARELAQKTGLPQDTVERNLPRVEQEQGARELPWEEIAQSKELQRYLADPDRAAVIRDDIPHMLSFQRALLHGGPIQGVPPPQGPLPSPLLDILGARFESGRRTAFETPAAAFPLIWGALGLTSPATPAERAAWRELQSRPIGPTGRPGFADDFFGAPLEQLPILARTARDALLGGAGGAALGAGAGALFGGGGALPGAVTGFGLGAKTGSAVSSFLVESSSAYSEFENLVGADGQPIPEDAAAAGAVIVGAINTGLETGGFLYIAKRIPGLDKLTGAGKELVAESVKRQVRNPLLRAQLLAAAKEVAKAVGVEMSTEVAQETTNIEVGRQLTGTGVGLPTSEELDRLGDTAVQTALGVFPLVGVGQTVQVKMDRISQARQNAAKLQLASEAVAQAQVREISPAAFSELTESLAREAGIEDVRIPARSLLERFVDAGGTAQDLVTMIPEAAGQLEEALGTDGDLRIPVGRYFQAVEGQLGPDLIQNVRLRPEDMTLREAQATEAELPAQVDREVQLAAAAAEAHGQNLTSSVREAAPAAPVTPALVEAAPGVTAQVDNQIAQAPVQDAAQPWAVDAIRRARTKGEVSQILALDRAQDSLGLAAPLFTDPVGVLTGDEFAEYQQALSVARTKAQAKLSGELAREAGHKTAAAKAEQRTMGRVRRDFQSQATAEVDRSPAEQARKFLTLRVDHQTTPEQRLDRDQLRELGQSPYGGSWEYVVPRGMQQVGGLHPDSVAELFGYPSGRELVDAIVSAPERSQAIADKTQARMIERFGDAQAKRAEASVLDAASNDEQFRVLQIEERILSKMTGGRPVDRQTVLLAARRFLAARPVKDIRPDAYRDQARRSSLAAVEFVGQRDYVGAQDAKRSQILNLTLEREARRVRDEVEKGDRALARVARKKATRARIAQARGGEFLRQIDALLERHGLRTPRAGAEQAGPIAGFARELEDAGEEVVLSDRLRDDRQRAPARDLSLADWRDLRDAVANLAELATREQTLTNKREKAQLADIERHIVEAIEAQGFRSKEKAGFSETKLERVRAHARGLDAGLRKAEFVIDALSGDDPGSFLRRFVWEPLRDAQGVYNAKLAGYTEKLATLRTARGEDAVKGWDRELDETRLVRPSGTPYKLTKWNAIMLALNMGNASNTQKLLKGYGWNQATVDAVLDQHLDKQDWQFVQGVWDLVDSLWPDIKAMERRISGVAPPRIEAQTVRTRHGDFRGGYFPVVYDPDLSQVGQRAEANQIMPNTAEGFTRATTGHGHTRERTKVAAPIKLAPSVIANHLDQVILDLTHREALIDAQRVLARPGVDAAITKALGREFGFRDFWAPRLRSVARDTADPGAMAAWERNARWVRQRGTVFKLGFRLTTLLMQASGHFNGFRAIQQAGGTSADWARGVWESLGRLSPTRAKDTYESVYQASPFMRDRAGTSSQELRELVRQSSTSKRLSAKVSQFALELIGQVQLRTVDMPIWLAAHGHAIGEGMTEERAVKFADSIVSKSQGGGTRLDQSAFEAQDGMARMLTMFYSYNNTVYNQIFRKGDFGAARLADYAMYVIGPGIFSAAMYGMLNGEPPDPDDKDYHKKMAKALAKIALGEVAGSMPLVRDSWTLALGENARSSSAPDVFYREVADLVNVKDGTDFMFDALRSGGLAAGLPVSAPLRMVEGMIREK